MLDSHVVPGVGALLVVVGLGCASPARADVPHEGAQAHDGEGAPALARAGSTTLLVGAQLASAAAPLRVGIDATLRLVPVDGLYLAPRLGGALSGTPVGAAWSWVLHAGLGVGWITALGEQVGFTLGVGYDLIAVASLGVWLTQHRLLAELALPLVLGRAVVEPYLSLGTQVVDRGFDGALGLGVRAGLTW